jgi:hypothetical protein
MPDIQGVFQQKVVIAKIFEFLDRNKRICDTINLAFTLLPRRNGKGQREIRAGSGQ